MRIPSNNVCTRTRTRLLKSELLRSASKYISNTYKMFVIKRHSLGIYFFIYGHSVDVSGATVELIGVHVFKQQCSTKA